MAMSNDKQKAKGQRDINAASAWHTSDELIGALRRDARTLRIAFEQEFPENSEKATLRESWERRMILLEGELVSFAQLIAEESRRATDSVRHDDRAMLVHKVHMRVKDLAWNAAIDGAGVVLAVVTLRGGDIAGGAAGAALNVADLIRSVYQSISVLDADEVHLYNTVAAIERRNRLHNVAPPFPTQDQVVDEAVSGQTNGGKGLRQALHEKLGSMLGKCLVAKNGGRISVY